MTEEELKFLEVIYNRGSIPERSCIHFMNKSRQENPEKEDRTIEEIFSRFQDSGLIDNQNEGTYRITPLGKEKFEELSEKKKSDRIPMPTPPKKVKSFHLGGRVWLALLILVIIVSIITSTIINRWDHIMNLFRGIWP
jgi:hypothetical protein